MVTRLPDDRRRLCAQGSHHYVATLIDLAVVDPVTHSLILRAGGTDMRNRNTTLIGQEREARESQAVGFANATTQLIENFDLALTKYQVRARILSRDLPHTRNFGRSASLATESCEAHVEPHRRLRTDR